MTVECGATTSRLRPCRIVFCRHSHVLVMIIVVVVATCCVPTHGMTPKTEEDASKTNDTIDLISAWRIWWMQRLYEIDQHHKQIQQALVQVALSVLKNQKTSQSKRQNLVLPVKEWLVLVSNNNGDDSSSWKQCRRMARVVHQEEASVSQEESCRDNADESVAVQVRDSGAVSEFLRPFSFFSSKDDEDLFVGMMLQVYVSHARDCHHLDDGEGVQLEQFNQQSTEMIADVTYELLEPIHMQLGIVPKHVFDYAYRPVVSFTPNLGADDSTTTTSVTKKSSDGWWSNSHSTKSSSWWQWFLSSGASFRQWTGQGDSSANYERMGDRAFAGGSHGEVWRARKRYTCRDRGSGTQDTNDSQRQEQTSRSKTTTYKDTDDEDCSDDTTPLIMKRLKVEHGFPLLEAGLREIYFGSLLGQELVAATRNRHVTSYVDHFFREVAPPAFSLSRSKKNLELWIVFEDAGPSLRSYLYTPVTSGNFLIYQHSSFWTRLRMNGQNETDVQEEKAPVAIRREFDLETERLQQSRPVNDSHGENYQFEPQEGNNETITEGRVIMREILRQILEAASFLHEHGIVHRDIKPSNVMCKSSNTEDGEFVNHVAINASRLNCVLGDFSSAWDPFTAQNLYVNGPSAQEQTDAYAPPEVLFGPTWVPFHEEKPQSYDSWSIGVLALELLLGTPNVFSVDQRTTALLTNKMTKEGATDQEIQRALYLAALSQFCIYMPSVATDKKEKKHSWPLRHGDPLHNVAMVKQSCTIQDFHHALRARDPLGLGLDSTGDPLLRLIWGLLAWDPLERLTASEALQHPYFTMVDSNTTAFADGDLVPGDHNALESQMLDPRMDIRPSQVVEEFTCPKCGRKFEDWQSCHKHANVRRHGKFCTYDTSSLPTCLNAHSMLPAHPTSGYCDIQGRRRVMEDFHAVQLHPTHQYYGMFDGHTGNLASKYVASTFYKEISAKLSDLDQRIKKDDSGNSWKSQVEVDMGQAFADIHDRFLEAVTFAPMGLMDQSGTTATILFVTEESAVVVASIGDSRAVLASSSNSTTDKNEVVAIQLTMDHVASDPMERKMVEERGGFVSSSGGIDRVNGTLVVTRSIGDTNLAPVLSRVPHVVALNRTDLRELCGYDTSAAHQSVVPCFLVLASDGLWDVMSNQEAVDMVSQVVQKYDSNHGISWEEGGAFQEAAQMLTQEAYVRGSTDNIGVCVVAIE